MNDVETLPDGWRIGKPFRYCHIIRGNSPFQKDDLKETGDFVAVQYGKSYKVDVIDGNFNFYVSNSFHKESQEVKQGDTVYITTSETVEDLGHTCYYDRSDIGLLGGEQMVLRPFEHIWDNKFFFYSASCFYQEMNKFATGLKVYRVKAEDLKRIDMCIPPKVTQIKLSAYLDKKTTAIDTLIASYEKLLVLLAEKRQAIISEAVTKGLDPHAEMKDSGVEWIGEIPVGWEVKQIKNIAKINGRIGFKGYNAIDLVDESEMGRAIVLGGTNVMPTGKIEYEKITYLSEYKYLESPEIMLKGNEILITKVGAGTGESAIYKYREERVTINPNVMLVNPTSSCSNFFLLYFLLCDYNKKNIRLESMKSGAQPAINQEFIKNIRFPFPPLEIQEQIVQYLDEKTSKIDQITTDTKEQIKLLKEYRQSLISEVVTGKVEV